ncbi:inositol 2-dehydrogenase [Phytohabitans flavus]|uniref:1-carboxy-3-chloro-3,4-dihydroxycyclo hexa-1,5-diene dehydrogenase n=1 Tax=Phytohabitans flavus TaxID=1076124 RepID=A0A6F8Y488_9ACTN|nr:Gfo/Idh/MocA family oxidoreductase [Phytohabitans flavus]BCB80843.1 1-carboxy-3-chloro-3,4-dihydroxycyclo hexa-1,5-diene dehydrogenase [Phytohabitans flavus]
MTGVCVVGAGFWAREMHLPALAKIPGVKIVSVVATSEESAKVAAGPYGARAFTDLEAAVADPEVDVVDVVAPPDVHLPAVLAAARHGRHAICIKPLGRTVAEADEMLAAVAAAGTRLFYAENVPFIPALQEARKLVDSGQIGDVFRVKACEGIGEPHSPWFFDPVRSGGGAILDMAVHSIEFCRFFAGAPVASVYADAGTFRWADRTTAEDTAVLTLRFANGVIGQCEDSWSLAGAMDSRFEVYGTQGRVLVDNLHRQPLQAVSESAGWSYPLPVPGLLADGHLDMLTHFIDRIRDGAPSKSDGHVGRDVLAVVEAALRSVASGRREEVAR